MKRSWFSILTVAGVVGLLTLFLGLQYRWLTEVSDAERERMHKRAEMDSHRLVEDFNREMQAAFYNFQTDAEVWKKENWNEFNERYDFWKGRTAYPELIRDIYFLGSDGAKRLKYDVAKRAFEPSEPNETLDQLRTRLSSNDVRSFYPDSYALVAPIYDDEKNRVDHIVVTRSPLPGKGAGTPFVQVPDRFGWLVVLLNDGVIKQRILPELATKYFPEGDYKVAVVDEGAQPVFATQNVTEPEVKLPIFDMSPDNMMFFRSAMPKGPGEEGHDVVINQRVESQTLSRVVSDKPTNGQLFEFKMKEAGGGSRPRVATMTATTAGASEPWTLEVQHAAGSIDAFVRAERNKSFAIGLGIYILLVGAILAIILSSLRSKRFAQRQIDFVSSVSHEFRTPLAVIYSAGENLADGVAKEDAQVARYGELIKGEGKKLSGMVEQILEFAGANSGRRNFKFAATDVRDLVRDAVHECGPLIESGGFTIEEEVQDGLPSISADRSAMSSAIQNLIANSVKYSNGSKWIRVSAVNGGGSVKIAVEDRGIGIAGDELRHVFEPFYRGKEVVDSQIHGNGLGLNLVQKIVDAHGGRVTAESRPGEGSTFTIELPV